MPLFVLSVFYILLGWVQIRSVSEPLPLMRMPYLDSFGLNGICSGVWGTALSSRLVSELPTLTLLVLPRPRCSSSPKSHSWAVRAIKPERPGKEHSLFSISPSLSIFVGWPWKALVQDKRSADYRESCPILFWPCRGMWQSGIWMSTTKVPLYYQWGPPGAPPLWVQRDLSSREQPCGEGDSEIALP